MSDKAQYSDATRLSLQRMFGNGFTSPGGPDHMARLLNGLDIAGLEIMDLGCGLGGDSLLLGGTFKAASVTSIDVDAGNLDVTRNAVREAGFEDVIRPTLVEPGPLPFPDCHFDVVHSKAMMCHIPDLILLFQEIHRVLRPGGTFVAADWMKGCDTVPSQSYQDFVNDLVAAGLIFHFKSSQAHKEALAVTGFEHIEVRDVSADIADFAEKILDDVMGNARSELICAMGEDGYEGLLRRSRGRAEALANGDLQFQYIKAVRPILSNTG